METPPQAIVSHRHIHSSGMGRPSHRASHCASTFHSGAVAGKGRQNQPYQAANSYPPDGMISPRAVIEVVFDTMCLGSNVVTPTATDYTHGIHARIDGRRNTRVKASPPPDWQLRSAQTQGNSVLVVNSPQWFSSFSSAEIDLRTSLP